MNRELFIEECVDYILSAEKDDIDIYYQTVDVRKGDIEKSTIELCYGWCNLTKYVKIYYGGDHIKTIKLSKSEYRTLKNALDSRYDILNNVDFYNIFERTKRDETLDKLV